MAFKVVFEDVQKKKVKLRLALSGATGGGKTYGSILIAKGLGGNFALLDTERRSSHAFAKLGPFKVIPMNDSFEVENFITVIKECEKSGFNTLIIDSLSHAWSGVGGILDQHEKKSAGGNSFAAWKKITPMQNLLIDTILKSSMHIICTMRAKMAHDMQDDVNGKKKIVKLGLSPVQRGDIEYEFTTVFDMNPDGKIVSCSKDRTGMFDGKDFKITIETGKQFLEWLDDGVDDSSMQEKSIDSEGLRAENGDVLDDHIDIIISSLSKCKTLEELKKEFTAAFKSLEYHPRIGEIVQEKERIKAFIIDAQQKITKEMNNG